MKKTVRHHYSIYILAIDIYIMWIMIPLFSYSFRTNSFSVGFCIKSLSALLILMNRNSHQVYLIDPNTCLVTAIALRSAYDSAIIFNNRHK